LGEGVLKFCRSRSFGQNCGKCKAEIEAEAQGQRRAGYELAENVRCHERSAAERVNARLKDEFGGRNVRVRGHSKVLCHLMFGILVLTVDQLMRLTM
jgi:hypothetical protein